MPLKLYRLKAVVFTLGLENKLMENRMILTDFCPDFLSGCRIGQEMTFRMDSFYFL